MMNPVTFATDSGSELSTASESESSEEIVRERLERVRSFSVKRFFGDSILKREDSEALAARSICHSGSGTFVRRSIEELSGTEKVTGDFFIEMDLQKEKFRIKKHLREFSSMMSQLLKPPQKEGGNSDKFSFSSQVREDCESVGQLFQLVQRGVELNLKGIFDDQGKWLEFAPLLTRIQELVDTDESFAELKYPRLQASLANSLHHLKKNPKTAFIRRSLRKLELPKAALTFSEKEQTVIRLLQRLYPGGSQLKGYIDPVHLLVVYPRYVASDRLFELIKLLIDSSRKQVPVLQKIRLFNFCRAWLSLGFHHDLLSSNQLIDSIEAIAKQGICSEEEEVKEICHEIFSLLKAVSSSNKRYYCLSGPDSIEEKIENLSNGTIKETASLFAEDCFQLSRAQILNIPMHELLCEVSETKHAKKMVNHFERLAEYVKQTIFSPLSVNNPDKALRIMRMRVKFWVEAASQLSDRGDFSSALAVVGALNFSAIARLFIRHKGLTIEKKDDSFSNSAFEKWRLLDTQFSPQRDFFYIRQNSRQRVAEQKEQIPYLGILAGHLMHIQDGNKECTDTGVNIEKIQYIAHELLNFWEDTAVLRSEAASSPSKAQLKTNLKMVLVDLHSLSDDTYWGMSQQILPTQGKHAKN